jgi:hypothetical protein
MAAATHSSWLRPGRYHERALERVGYLLNIYNGRDRILKRYQAIDKCSKPKALGYKGMFTADLGTDGERIEQIDAASVVGREHSIANYQRHPWLRSRIQKALFAANPAAN